MMATPYELQLVNLHAYAGWAYDEVRNAVRERLRTCAQWETQSLNAQAGAITKKIRRLVRKSRTDWAFRVPALVDARLQEIREEIRDEMLQALREIPTWTTAANVRSFRLYQRRQLELVPVQAVEVVPVRPQKKQRTESERERTRRIQRDREKYAAMTPEQRRARHERLYADTLRRRAEAKLIGIKLPTYHNLDKQAAGKRARNAARKLAQQKAGDERQHSRDDADTTTD
jgi:hypothetical protein